MRTPALIAWLICALGSLSSLNGADLLAEALAALAFGPKAPPPVASDDAIRRLDESVPVPANQSLLSSFTELRQVADRAAEIQTRLYATNAFLRSLDSYHRSVTQWLNTDCSNHLSGLNTFLKQGAENGRATNKQVFDSMTRLMTPLITQELLEQPEFTNLVSRWLEILSRRKVEAQFDAIRCADEMIGWPGTNVPPAASLDSSREQLRQRATPIRLKLDQLLDRHPVPAKIVRAAWIRKEATILIDSSACCFREFAPDELRVLRARAEVLRRQLQEPARP